MSDTRLNIRSYLSCKVHHFCTHVVQPVVVIAGPTASGKSALALHLAETLQGVIINADSQQLYQGLDLLTAKPSLEDLAICPHQLYGTFPNVAPGLNAASWRAYACQQIDQAHGMGQIPFVVGGTGFYLKALIEGLSGMPFIPRDPSFNDKDMYQRLCLVDPELGQRLHPSDRQRIQRALEVFKVTGRPLSFWQKQPRQSCLSYQFFTIMLLPSLDVLTKRIGKRFTILLQQGLLQEVAQYQGGSKESLSLVPLSQAIGLKVLQQFQKGELSWSQAQELFIQQTRQYAKRQRTWFKGQLKSDEILQFPYPLEF